ncbi:Crp/Fnr family transcriptional regulator [Altererythrobacter sp. B11]|uniref:Crp/Fnr family transcriptional regulator n=1 Tax=Altererythrobacter sp. B11 TaxID=2060312 RepID=UPI000E5BE3A6|nr:Crp/Fnr family transcriptional regulator [Altererythrobacter sp. B11]
MRNAPKAGEYALDPALKRLNGLTPLDEPATAALRQAFAGAWRVPAAHELQQEGKEVPKARLLLGGWAARFRILEDGRRQLISLFLPGELIGMYDHAQPLAASHVTAITDVLICTAPPPETSPRLAEAYALSRALEEAYLLNQITRLGRLSGLERLLDLLLELRERLDRCGLADGGSFPFPLTQEATADALGLTSVHLNRMAQQARQTGDLDWRAKQVTLRDPAGLARKLGRNEVRVSAGPAS